ncbi:MAG TPA: RNA polymerase subunit sigma-70 [Actinospica sp.]|nr:RNA polymerase subunit sigma-70 [Actinospica sp.]
MGDAGTGTGTEDFERRIDSYRTELFAHCYRMLGSVHDAEDLVQDTYLRAWRAREQYDERRASVRTWLYRIATNACLTALAGRERRPLPSGLVEQGEDPAQPFVHGGEVPWLQPVPDALLGPAPRDPAAAAAERASLRLAFLAALQHLSARERATLVLREVLQFSATEAAEILDTTAAGINSALQRARARLAEAAVAEDGLAESTEPELRLWVERYVESFEKADLDGLKRLLAADVVLEMPPMVNWYVGPERYTGFIARVFTMRGTNWRMVPVGANRQPAIAAYVYDDGCYRLHTVQVFDFGQDGVRRNTAYQNPEAFAAFDLAPVLEAGPSSAPSKRASA